MSQNAWRRWKAVLIAGSILAAVKVIFVDYTMDEEYQVVMAYRNLSGDTLFGTMWEPHQTSAFLCVWLMRIFAAITGGTAGVVLFLRCATALIQLSLALWLVRVLKGLVGGEAAFLLGVCYFNIVPKLIQTPEFSNLQLWFFTVAVLSLLQYYDLGDGARGTKRGGPGVRKLWLAAGGLGMALEVLSYPSSVLLFPFFLGCIFLRSGRAARRNRGRFIVPALADCALFGGTCGLCAAVWLCRILSGVTWQEFVRNVGYILAFDPTHDLSLAAEYRTAALARDLRMLLVLLLVSGALALLFWLGLRFFGKRGPGEGIRWSPPVFAVLLVLSAELVQLYYWMVLQKGYEEPQIHLLVVLLAAAAVWRYAGPQRGALCIGLLGGALSILVVIYMSDLGIVYSIPHGLLGVIFAAAVLVCALERQGKEGRMWIHVLLLSLALCSIFGKGFTLRAGKTETNSVLGIGGIIREGPAAGVLTNYMQAYIANCTYEDFMEETNEGETCLIVTNRPGESGTSPYLFRNLSVSHFSIVDPTSYDERLLTYWELYPEKAPDVVVVDCWYGQLMEAEDSWILQYLEKEFGYTEATDGRYVRFYRRSSGQPQTP